MPANFRALPVCEKIDARLTIDEIEDFRLPLSYTEFVRFSRLVVLLFSPFLFGIPERPAPPPPPPSKNKISLPHPPLPPLPRSNSRSQPCPSASSPTRP